MVRNGTPLEQFKDPLTSKTNFPIYFISMAYNSSPENQRPYVSHQMRCQPIASGSEPGCCRLNFLTLLPPVNYISKCRTSDTSRNNRSVQLFICEHCAIYRIFLCVTQPSVVNRILWQKSHADLSMNGLARLGRYYRLTEDQHKLTAFVPSYFVGKCETRSPMIQKYLNRPLCVVWVTMRHYCIVCIRSCFPSGRIETL